MKLAGHENELRTNAKVVSKDFRIGNASIIINMLRNHLYTHKVRTLVQEYMSNGRDAMREAKSKGKITVSIPNALSPVFKVRDFGPGITPERMDNVFTQYGESTKRDNNDENGGFGIGAKSAWAYTDSFTIISITGGVKRTYVAHTGVNNQGRLDMLSEVNSDEETGTEIQIAVQPNDLREFKNAIMRACYFWKPSEYPTFKGITKEEWPASHKPGIVLDKMEFVSNYLPDYLELNFNSWNNTGCAIIIDGIPYSVDKSMLEHTPDFRELLNNIHSKVLIHLDNGEIEVVAHREKISDSKITRTNLEQLTKKLNKILADYIVDEFKKAKTYAQWIETYKNLAKITYVDQYSKKGPYSVKEKMIESVNFGKFFLMDVGANFGRRGRGGFKRDEVQSIPLERVGHIFYVDNDDSIVIQNRRIKEYLETHKVVGIAGGLTRITLMAPVAQVAAQTVGLNPMPTTVVVRSTPADSMKTILAVAKDLGARPLSSLPYTPIVREPRAAKLDRTKEMFTIHECYGNGRKTPKTTTLEEISGKTDKYLYVDFKDHDSFQEEFREMSAFLATLGYTACCLTEKTVKMVADSEFFAPYKDWKKSFKPDEKIVKAVKLEKAKNSEAMKFLAGATITIKDTFLRKMVKQYENVSSSKMVLIPTAIAKLVSKDVEEFVKDDAELTKLLKESYPLVNVVDSYSTYHKNKYVDEVVSYINAKVKND